MPGIRDTGKTIRLAFGGPGAERAVDAALHAASVSSSRSRPDEPVTLALALYLDSVRTAVLALADTMEKETLTGLRHRVAVRRLQEHGFRHTVLGNAASTRNGGHLVRELSRLGAVDAEALLKAGLDALFRPVDEALALAPEARR